MASRAMALKALQHLIIGRSVEIADSLTAIELGRGISGRIEDKGLGACGVVIDHLELDPAFDDGIHQGVVEGRHLFQVPKATASQDDFDSPGVVDLPQADPLDGVLSQFVHDLLQKDQASNTA